MTKPYLSIIIPAYNEALRLPKTLPEVVRFVEQQPFVTEVIVVENGSSDGTSAVVEEFARRYPFIRLIHATERGKGRAIRLGMLSASGEYRFMCDADLSMPLSELPKFFAHNETNDMVIGSREGIGARRIHEPVKRHLVGRIANFMIQIIAVRGYADTQCGFKLFSERAALDLFSVQRLNGIGFDAELLFLAEKRHYNVEIVPVLWYYDDDTRIELVRDSLGMFKEIMQIRRNWENGLYSPPMAVVERQSQNQYA